MDSHPYFTRAVDAHSIGRTTRQFVVQAPASGKLAYKMEDRKTRQIDVSPELGGRTLGILALRDMDAFFDVGGNLLLALGYFHRQGPIVFLMGPRYGLWVSPSGTLARTRDPLGELRRLGAPLSIERDPLRLCLRFVINPYNRERFSAECMDAIRSYDDSNDLEMRFDPLTGQMTGAELFRQGIDSETALKGSQLFHFPLVWPAAEAAGVFEGTAAPGLRNMYASVTEGIRPRRAERRPIGAPGARPSPPEPAPPSPGPERGAPAAAPHPDAPPSTAHLPIKQMLAAVRAQKDPLTRWTMILENLKLKKPDRTYQLLTEFGDLIGENTSTWSFENVHELMQGQSGPVIIPMLNHYPVDVALALAEERPDGERLVEWLGVHEGERLLRIDPTRRPLSEDEARRLMNVSERATAKAIRRVWRRQLFWLGADFGRHQERAIHQKKDAIAKVLQAARDQLLAGMKDRRR